MSSGIYAIKNTLDGKSYIGCSQNMQDRWLHHRKRLRKGTHHSPYLQNSWNKYGEDAFELTILEECKEEEDLELREGYWQSLHKTCDRDFGYNTKLLDGWGRPRKISESTKKKLAEINRLGPSPETQEKIRQIKKAQRLARQAIKIEWEKANPKQSYKPRSGFTLTEDHKNKISQAQIGKIVSDLSRFRLSEAKCKFDKLKYFTILSMHHIYGFRKIDIAKQLGEKYAATITYVINKPGPLYKKWSEEFMESQNFIYV